MITNLSIFANFWQNMLFFLKTNVMIPFFAVFSSVLSQKWQLSQIFVKIA
jgi:hypothetical protein